MKFKFQFLIGWLQTYIQTITKDNTSAEVSIPYRLATNYIVTLLFAIKYKRFQFLIGWLQTYFQLALLLVLLMVSIPYRLATNFFYKWCKPMKSWFQFLIGWLQTVLLNFLP